MKCILLIVFIFLPLVVFSQNSAEKLRQTREKTLKEIEYANQLLKETEGKTKQSLNEINIINHRLSKRKEVLLGLEIEVNVLSEEIERNLNDISVIEQEINKIKLVYAAMISNLYKNKIARFRAMYFIASKDFNQLYKRIHTVKLYNNYLKKEREKLEVMRSELDQQNKELEELKRNKDLMVSRTKQEALTIQREIGQKNKLVKQLKQRQKEIEEDIRNKERTARKLENELKKIIEEERRKSSTDARVSMTPEDRIVSSDFEKNSGKLPWPTQKGIITGKYGEHPHPDYKNVMVRNDGVYIATAEGETARAIFKGTVSRVFQIPSEPGYSVIIKHGQYYSVYHNLINVKIKTGQTVNTKEEIGTVFTDKQSRETILYFQIWKDRQKNDPEIWLAPM
ncbi:MAG TPA: peptidoglycan DD-metalloendopeptidase family protein [Bacteroidales bacterium]|jgi:septal ring factor EnvC (AmiA/AmiB activator)|nr:peptidoglycan DD-metalloendopeptidase family protein [Bacteroidales bacterium]